MQQNKRTKYVSKSSHRPKKNIYIYHVAARKHIKGARGVRQAVQTLHSRHAAISYRVRLTERSWKYGTCVMLAELVVSVTSMVGERNKSDRTSLNMICLSGRWLSHWMMLSWNGMVYVVQDEPAVPPYPFENQRNTLEFDNSSTEQISGQTVIIKSRSLSFPPLLATQIIAPIYSPTRQRILADEFPHHDDLALRWEDR